MTERDGEPRPTTGREDRVLTLPVRQHTPDEADKGTSTGDISHSPAAFLAGRHVLVIGINYAPEPTGIAPYTTGVAEELARHADEVTVLTGLPHYPSWSVPRDERRRRTELPHTTGRPRVIRLGHYVPRRQSAIRRALYEWTFLLHVLWAARRLPRRPDLIVSVTPALGGAVAAARTARRLDVPLITIVQDLMAKAAAQSGIKGGGGLVHRGTATLERFALRHATRVAVVAEEFRSAVEAYGVPCERIDHLPNWTHVRPTTLDRTQARRRLGWPQSTFIAAHTGNIGLKQDLGNLVETARLLSDDGGAQIVIIGDGSQREPLAQHAGDVPSLRLLDPLDDESYPVALAASDVLLVNERASVSDMSLPSKLTSYFAAGRPVLAAVAADGATARELRRTDGAGHVVPPSDPAALAEALRTLRGDVEQRAAMSLAARRYAAQSLSAAQAMTNLMVCVSRALPVRPRTLRRFGSDGYDKGRGRAWQVTWFATMNLVFMAWWFPARWRPTVLRWFGAEVGRRVLIRHRVRVLWPWKLRIGNDCWIGEDAWLLNLEQITLEDDVCLSQAAFLCTGSHDHTSDSFGYDNGPIHLETGVWVAARATVLRGSRVPAGHVVPAASVYRASRSDRLLGNDFRTDEMTIQHSVHLDSPSLR